MSDSRFFQSRGPVRLSELLTLSGATLAQPSHEDAWVEGVAALSQAEPGQLSFFHNPRYRDQLRATRASFVLVTEEALEWVPPTCQALLSADPYRAYGLIAAHLVGEAHTPPPGVHPSAFVDPSARLGPGVRVGPQASVEAGADLAEDVWIEAGARIGPGVQLGARTRVGPNAVVTFCIAGVDCHFLGGCTIGQRGFGWAMGPDGHTPIPQLGRVLIGDRVEIGASTTVDRGANGDTRIGDGTVIDNLVQVGHNVVLGQNCVIVSHVAIAGTAEIGDRVVMAGTTAVVGHIKIDSDTTFLAPALVTKSLSSGIYSGMPVEPVRDYRRRHAVLSRLVKREGRKREDE